MGVFYYIHSVALVEDLPLEEHYHTPQEFYAAADKAYSQVTEPVFLVI
jgi:ribonuclease kappa